MGATSDYILQHDIVLGSWSKTTFPRLQTLYQLLQLVVQLPRPYVNVGVDIRNPVIDGHAWGNRPHSWMWRWRWRHGAALLLQVLGILVNHLLILV